MRFRRNQIEVKKKHLSAGNRGVSNMDVDQDTGILSNSPGDRGRDREGAEIQAPYLSTEDPWRVNLKATLSN